MRPAADCILGVDPGISGALVTWDGSSIRLLDVPTIKVKVGKSLKSRIDAYALGNWLDLHRNAIRFAVIEQVGAMPKQGVTSSFNFGFTTGVLHGALAGNAIPMRTVVPGVWKRAFGLIGQPKDASRQAASRLAPQFSHYWARAKDDGRAEAFLLAIYGGKTWN